MPMADLMITLQQYLTAWSYPWLHPNYETIIAKSGVGVTVRLTGEPEKNSRLSLIAKMTNGSPEEFDSLVNSLRLLLRDEIEMDEAAPLTELNQVREGTLVGFQEGHTESECNPM
jgi:hypothetical protein